MISLACLDLAGTTVRDDGAVEGAFFDALGHLGITATDPRREEMLAYVRETMGTSKITVFRALFSDEEEAQRANRAFEDAYASRVRGGEIEAMPGAVQAIGQLRAAGVKVALLTGFSRITRDLLLGALGWGEIADLALCPEEAGRGRPFPDMVLVALLRLGAASVAEVAVVGDTAADIASGLAAGAGRVVGVLTGSDSGERLAEAGATDVIDSIAALPEVLGIG